jgi:hypothetical protein
MLYIRKLNTDLGPAAFTMCDRVMMAHRGVKTSNAVLALPNLNFLIFESPLQVKRVMAGSISHKYIVKRISCQHQPIQHKLVGCNQLKGPEDTGGYNTPFIVDISIAGNKSLLTWEVGEPGADLCTLYGQWSMEGGSTWGDQKVILDYRSLCPVGVDFLFQDESSIVGLLSYQGNPSLLAWNDDTWSEPQVQKEISYFSNPVTHETILLGCQFNFMYQDQLFLVGCDQGEVTFG